MVQLGRSSNRMKQPIGPLLDDGAPYSRIGIEEFKMIKKYAHPSWNGELDELPEKVLHRPYWQYGNGTQASSCRSILGSVMLNDICDEGIQVEIRHLVIADSSQWVIGRNVPSYAISYESEQTSSCYQINQEASRSATTTYIAQYRTRYSVETKESRRKTKQSCSVQLQDWTILSMKDLGLN